MSANLYQTKTPGAYYHIHGSLEASTTLKMIGLEPFRPDLITHEQIVDTIETAVGQFTVEQLEILNKANKQAGIMALKHEDFLRSSHVSACSVQHHDNYMLIDSQGASEYRTTSLDS